MKNNESRDKIREGLTALIEEDFRIWGSHIENMRTGEGRVNYKGEDVTEMFPLLKMKGEILKTLELMYMSAYFTNEEIRAYFIELQRLEKLDNKYRPIYCARYKPVYLARK